MPGTGRQNESVVSWRHDHRHRPPQSHARRCGAKGSASDRGSRRHQARPAASHATGRIGLDEHHLYEIRDKDVRFGLPDPDWPDGPLDARKARLIEFLEDAGTKTLRYLYDFGDGWEHTVKIERLTDPE